MFPELFLPIFMEKNVGYTNDSDDSDTNTLSDKKA